MFHSLWSAIGKMLGERSAAPAADTHDAASARGEVSTDDAPLSEPPPLPDETILSRNEVLDGDLSVRGYEFTVRAELRTKVRTQSRGVREFLDNMLVDQLSSFNRAVLKDRPAWVQLWESALTRPLVERLPSNSQLLIVPDRPDQPASEATRARMRALKHAGFEIWLDDCALTPWFGSLTEMARGTVIRTAMRAPFEITDALEKIRRDHPSLRRAAWEVATFEDLQVTRKLGCSLFAGGFVTHRGDYSGNTLSPQVMHIAMLINQVRADCDMREMAKVLKQDMAMSYRLLRYVNTAAQGLNHTISSIEQGLMVLGQSQLDRWLTLLLLGGGAGGGGALMEMALTRARFIELLGRERLDDEKCERLFVLGLFSMLDIALQVPLAEAVRPLRLPEVMNQALLEHKGPFGIYLALADACERGHIEKVCKLSASLGLMPATLNRRQLEALEWVATASQPAPV